MSGDIEWVDEVPRSRYRSSFSEFYAALRERPRSWAMYPTTMSNTAATSQYAKRRPGFEFRARKINDEADPDYGRARMYVRYVGDES